MVYYYSRHLLNSFYTYLDSSALGTLDNYWPPFLWSFVTSIVLVFISYYINLHALLIYSSYLLFFLHLVVPYSLELSVLINYFVSFVTFFSCSYLPLSSLARFLHSTIHRVCSISFIFVAPSDSLYLWIPFLWALVVTFIVFICLCIDLHASLFYYSSYFLTFFLSLAHLVF